MKKRVLIIFCAILFSGCSIEQIAKLEINNESGYLLHNISFKYTSADGDKEILITELEMNKTYDREIKIADSIWGVGGGSYAAGFSIEYYIGSQYFNIINDIDVQRTSDGAYYNNKATLTEGNTTVINIYDYGYQIVQK